MMTAEKQAVCDRMMDRIERKYRAGEITAAERDERMGEWSSAWAKWAVELAREAGIL